jgi:hypothetical protein
MGKLWRVLVAKGVDDRLPDEHIHLGLHFCADVIPLSGELCTYDAFKLFLESALKNGLYLLLNTLDEGLHSGLGLSGRTV